MNDMDKFAPVTVGAALLNKYTALTCLVLIAITVFVIWAVRRLIRANMYAGNIPEDENEFKRIAEERKRAIEETLDRKSDGNREDEDSPEETSR